MAFFADKGVKFITLGWTTFILENVVISHHRDYIIHHLGGESTYRGLYSSLSTLATGSIAYGYFKYAKNKGPLAIQTMSKTRLGLGFFFTSLGLIGFSQCLPGTQLPYAQGEIRCPFDFKSGQGETIYGMKRVTRHDKLWSFAWMGLGSALCTPFVGEMIMFGMPCVFAVIGGWH